MENLVHKQQQKYDWAHIVCVITAALWFVHVCQCLCKWFHVSVYTCVDCVYVQLSAWKCVRVDVVYVCAECVCVCMKSDELIVALWMVIIQPPLSSRV